MAKKNDGEEAEKGRGEDADIGRGEEAEEGEGGVDERAAARLSPEQMAEAHKKECYTYAPHSDFDCHGHKHAKWKSRLKA